MIQHGIQSYKPKPEETTQHGIQSYKPKPEEMIQHGTVI